MICERCALVIVQTRFCDKCMEKFDSLQGLLIAARYQLLAAASELHVKGAERGSKECKKIVSLITEGLEAK